MKVLTFIIICIILIGCTSNLEDCKSPIRKDCYKYITVGGLFGGVAEKQVSCNSKYDYYRNVSIDWTNCNPTYLKGFD